jgi:hypothetical protein
MNDMVMRNAYTPPSPPISIQNTMTEFLHYKYTLDDDDYDDDDDDNNVVQ